PRSRGRRDRGTAGERRATVTTPLPLESQLAEGDSNLTPARRRWQAANLDAETSALIDEDAALFLHQSLSTPCLNAVVEADGAWTTDAQGRRSLDFHGNSVQQVGYRTPRVIEAVRRQMEVLPFSPRRYTNRPAVELARKLVELAPEP